MSDENSSLENGAPVQDSLRRIAARLTELNISYAVIGALAVAHHGYRRSTEDIDLLVTRDGLEQIHRALVGGDYVQPFERSKDLRDTQSGVKIRFLRSGEYPGDGNPKPVQFPDPESASVQSEGIKYLTLPVLIELKLASGLTGPGRAKDSADVQQLIKLRKLTKDYATWLNRSVRDKYLELWSSANRSEGPAELSPG